MDNQTMMQFFEWYLPEDGILWDRVACLAPRLKKGGIDIVWLPPAYKGAGGRADTGYGVYDLYDLGEFDQKGSVETKYGGRESYLNAVRACQKEEIAVLADMVLNHRLGADHTETVRAVKVDPENRNNQISGEYDIDAWTGYVFPGRRGKYSNFNWDWQCFTGTDWDARANQGGVYRFAGKQWSGQVSQEKGNYDYLMGTDYDMANPVVVDELVNWGRWYKEHTGVDGFRLDALKHIDRGFICQWLDEVRKGQDMFAVGEYWTNDREELAVFLGQCGHSLSLFDVPLHFNFMNASRGGGNYDMRTLLKGSLIELDTMHTVTFVDNHDSQLGQALESWVEDWFKPLAYAVILLRRDGLPCIFYGDYYGMRGEGMPSVPGLRRMLHVRHLYAYGEQTDYFDDPDIVGWTRGGDEEHADSGCAVVITDREAGDKRMYIGTRFAGKTFRDCVRRRQEAIVVEQDGWATFKVAGGGVSVWVPEEAYRDIAVHYD